MVRTILEDFEDEYDPAVSSDVADIDGTYGNPARPGPFMLVAEDDVTGEVIATCGVRAGQLKAGLSPDHLVERYKDERTGQLVRVYVLKEHRRRGIAAALVKATLARASADGNYDRIALHTYPHSPGALAFWIAMGAEVVADDSAGRSRSIFFEFASTPSVGSSG